MSRFKPVPLLLISTMCAGIITSAVVETARAELGEYGPHVAYSKAADSDQGNYLVGGHLELRPIPFLGVKGAVDYRSSERFQVGTLDGGTVRVTSVPVTLSGKLYLPLAPAASTFLMGGGGWYRVHYDYSRRVEQTTQLHDQSITTFGWHVGAGLRLGLSSNVSLSGEAQYVFVDPQKKLNDEVRNQIRNMDYNSTTFGLGLNLAF
jgi:opacity protein-like surface antigen